MSHSLLPCGAHFTGSISLDGAADVLRTTGSILGDKVRRLPDGESLPPRSWWIGSQMRHFYGNPLFEALPPLPNAYAPMDRMKLRPNVTADQIRFPELGYASAARDSYRAFSELQREGVIDPRCRFQVSLPAPFDVILGIVHPDDRAVVESAYEQRMEVEIREICAAIPHHALAIQWDAPMEVGAIEWPDYTPLWFGSSIPEIKAAIQERFVRICSWVPAEVELGFHLCYGNFMHKHFVEPKDLAVVVDLANDTCAAVQRRVDFLHMPVPRERTDERYFAPLRELRVPEATLLYLGLVHDEDGVAGARSRIEAARRYRERFGIATECGMSNLPRATVEQLLRVHAELAGSAYPSY